MFALDGSTAGPAVNGLELGPGSDGSTIKGLIVNRFSGNGIVVASDDNTIVCNFVGTDSNGQSDLGNGGNGILILNAASNHVGGDAIADRNIIAGNDGSGIQILTGEPVVEGEEATSTTDHGGAGGSGRGNGPMAPSAESLMLDWTAIDSVFLPLVQSESPVLLTLLSPAAEDEEVVPVRAAADNTIKGNYIGTNIFGTVAIANSSGWRPDYRFRARREERNCL